MGSELVFARAYSRLLFKNVLEVLNKFEQLKLQSFIVNSGMSYGHIDETTLEIIIWAVDPDFVRQTPSAIPDPGSIRNDASCVYVIHVY